MQTVKQETAFNEGTIEGLGVFYLGRTVDSQTGSVSSEPLLVDSKRFTTHAVCVGMTGSGKTGLLIDLIEEAALDGIPALVIDPKGDLANVLLSFPNLSAADFLPWIEADAAAREGISLEEFAQRIAKTWSEGLAASGQSADRIARLHKSVEMAVYTPGSRTGRPLAMLQNLESPSSDAVEDPEFRRERIDSLVSGILALIGIESQPGRSREHVLISTIVDAIWRSGQRLDFGALVRAIPTPPVERVGFFELENFYPAGERFELASRLNTVAAAPGFDAWLEGEPLDVGRLLWTTAGKPRVSVVSIAHLNDSQRMAFVTLLTGQVISWMRSQRGTSSLKAMVLMDEVFGYMPPTANPPSKTPLLTLLKQARAYGLGVVLATQNPVDLDYKGLSNAGIWFLGRLQTARDKARVLDGLEGAAASAGRAFDRGLLDNLLSGLGQRMFLLHSVYDDMASVFQTRWTMAYLRGPLVREELKRLTAADGTPESTPALNPPAGDFFGAASGGGPRPILPPDVREVFFSPLGAMSAEESLHYQPFILGRAHVRYAKTVAGINADREVLSMAPASDSVGESAWERARQFAEAPEVEPAPRTGTFASLPSILSGPKGYASLATSLRNHLARTSTLVVWRAALLNKVSRPEESEADFRLRLSQSAKEWRDDAMSQVRDRYAAKLASLTDRVNRARQKVEREKSEALNQSMQTYVSIGTAVLGALLGRKLASSATVGRAATSMRSASRATRQQADVAHAEESMASLEEKLSAMEAEVAEEFEKIRLAAIPASLVLESIDVPAKKTAITVEDVVLAWVPSTPAALQ